MTKFDGTLMIHSYTNAELRRMMRKRKAELCEWCLLIALLIFLGVL